MNELQILIDQMVSDISTQAMMLDDLRLQSFLNWLNAHRSQMKTMSGLDERSCAGRIDEHLETGLKMWFATLPMQGLLWEYRLILDEIAWWRDLDPGRLFVMTEERQ